MKRKVIIELFLYIIVVIVSLILLLSDKPKEEQYQMQPDYEMSVIERNVNKQALAN